MKYVKILITLLTVFTGIPLLAAPLNVSTSCNLNKNSLGVGFSGHDADKIYNAVNGVLSKKDEYETQQQYETRSSHAVKNISNENLFCYVVKDKYFEPVYDAENQILWLIAFGTYRHLFTGSALWSHEYRHFVSDRNIKESSYTATNAFGVLKRVYKNERNVTYITFDANDTSSFLIKSGAKIQNASYTLPLNLSPEKARALKNKVKLAVQYQLVKPYIGKSDEFDTPTYDMPYETVDHKSVLMGRILKIVAFSIDNGEVLAEYNEK